MEPLTLLATVQDSGGLMLVVVWLAFEVRALKKDFQQHEKRFHGVGE